MSQGIVFYGEIPINFSILSNVVLLDIYNKEYTYTEEETKGINNLIDQLVTYDLSNFTNTEKGLSFQVSTNEYNDLILKSNINNPATTKKPVENWQIINTKKKLVELKNLTWHIASPTPKGGRRKTKRKLKRKSQTRVRRRR